MAKLQLGGGQTEQVPPGVLEAAKNALRQMGVGDDPAALAAFLRSAKDPTYRQQVPQLATAGKLPPQVAAAVNAYFGGAAAPDSGLPLPKLPDMVSSGLQGMASGYGKSSGVPGFPQNPLAMVMGR